jgi:O-acetyl-ADP-ribose deacetylase (regulator of RNase III)
MNNGGVFISYRREDTGGYARSLFDRLDSRFPGRVFMDVARLSPGVDYVEIIEQVLTKCEALIGLIGKHWAQTAEGINRFADRQDLLQFELAHALERKILVIPVLVGGATLPSSENLPTLLHPLLRRQVLELNDTNFEDVVARLIGALEERFGTPALVEPDVWADRVFRRDSSRERVRTAKLEIAHLTSADKIIANKKIGHGSVVVLNDDICNASFDVIVSSDDNHFRAEGGVSQMILKKLGPDVRRQLDYFRTQGFRQGEVAVTTGGDWNRRAVIHAAVVDLDNIQYPTLECIRTVTRRALHCADAMGARSIAFPVLGGGYAKTMFRPQDNVNVIASEIIAFLKEQRGPESSLRRVAFYIFKREDAEGLPPELQYPEKLFEVWPYCYHVTSGTNLNSIYRVRTLFPAATIFKEAGQHGICRERRTEDIVLRLDGHDVLIRNQSALSPEALDLAPGELLEDYVSCLNSRVFFWPGTASGPVDDGVRMCHRAAAGSIILRVPTRSLVSANPAAEVYISTCNTGAAWLDNGRKSRRGREVFELVNGFSGNPASIQEISFVTDIRLPTDTTNSASVTGPWHALL